MTCHNERLKTAGLTLEKLDVERRARQRRGAREGRPQAAQRADAARRAGRGPTSRSPTPSPRRSNARSTRPRPARPIPGRVASRRLNRAEYVNVIHDLLALDVDGTAAAAERHGGLRLRQQRRRAVDHAGADVALHVGGHQDQPSGDRPAPTNRPVMQVYKVDVGAKQDAADGRGHAVRDARRPRRAATPSRSTASTPSRCGCSATARSAPSMGIEEDEHQIEMRVDHALVKRFEVGGKYKGPDPGVLIAVPEDDVEGRKVHDYRLNADKDLKIRVPIKAGTRLVSATLHRFAAVAARRRAERRGREPRRRAPPASTRSTSPVRSTARRRTTRRAGGRSSSAVRPAAREEEPCARRIITTLARRAYRRPVTDADVKPLLTHLQRRPQRARLRRRHRARARSDAVVAGVPAPHRARSGRRQARQRLPAARPRARLAAVVLPVEEHPGRRAASTSRRSGRLKDPAVLAQQVADARRPRATRFMNDFVGQWLQVRNIQASTTRSRRCSPTSTTRCARRWSKETELFFESQVRDEPADSRAAAAPTTPS